MPKITTIAPVPKLRAAATLSQSNPVQNTWYPILDTKNNVQLQFVLIRVNTANEDLEVRFTIDGLTLVGTQSATAGTNYYAYKQINSAGDSIAVATSVFNAAVYSHLEGRSIKVEVRKTTATGAGDLLGVVGYAQW